MKKQLTCIGEILSLVICPKEMHTCKSKYIPIFTAALFIIEKSFALFNMKVDKFYYIHVVGYYIAVKINKLEQHHLARIIF